MDRPAPLNARISHWQPLGDDVAILGVTTDKPFRFEAGQYATLGLPGPDGRLVRRPMSIASPPNGDAPYQFLVRHVAGGTFTSLLWDRRVGDAVSLVGPKGGFLLRDDGRTAVFVASGTGLAPFRSMVEALRLAHIPRRVVLLHGVRRASDLAWRDEFIALETSGPPALCYVPTISRPQESPDWRGQTGRVESIVPVCLERFSLDASNATIYMCGNPDMIRAVTAIAAARGFPPQQIAREQYWPAVPPPVR